MSKRMPRLAIVLGVLSAVADGSDQPRVCGAIYIRLDR